MRGKKFAGALVAAPALLVPIVVVAAIGWADITFSEKSHPAVMPTVSRSISEPTIATPFAIAISVVGLLLGYVCWQIIVLLKETITETFKTDTRGRNWARIALASAGLAEAASIGGILCLVWYSEHTLHIGGSWFFFTGQSCAILLSGIVCALLGGAQRRQGIKAYAPVGLSVRLCRLRARVAPFIAMSAVAFGALYLIRESLESSPVWLQLSFPALELFLILSFLGYLATFSRELFVWKQARKVDR